MLRRFIAIFLSLAALSACQITPSRSVATLKHVEVNGVSLAYTEQGTGIPVVFVHGSMSDRRIWETQRLDIALSYRYIAYDQRYFGNEPWRDDGKNFDQMTHAADLVAFIQSLKAGPVHLVAWSYGGSVATLAASQHPDLFRSPSLHADHRQPDWRHPGGSSRNRCVWARGGPDSYHRKPRQCTCLPPKNSGSLF